MPRYHFIFGRLCFLLDEPKKDKLRRPLKPEDDILYQWRLQRRMAEAKQGLPKQLPSQLPTALSGQTQVGDLSCLF